MGLNIAHRLEGYREQDPQVIVRDRAVDRRNSGPRSRTKVSESTMVLILYGNSLHVAQV